MITAVMRFLSWMRLTPQWRYYSSFLRSYYGTGETMTKGNRYVSTPPHNRVAASASTHINSVYYDDWHRARQDVECSWCMVIIPKEQTHLVEDGQHWCSLRCFDDEAEFTPTTPGRPSLVARVKGWLW